MFNKAAAKGLYKPGILGLTRTKLFSAEFENFDSGFHFTLESRRYWNDYLNIDLESSEKMVNNSSAYISIYYSNFKNPFRIKCKNITLINF